MVPPNVPLVVASTAAVGLGSPGNSRKICDPHDRAPTLPRVDEKPRPSPRNVMFTTVPVVKLVTVEQLGETVHPSVMSGKDWKP
jgi:hypothetical protein